MQGLELVDNVRPLRNNIIDSVRAMPSYYEGRIRKDPVKPKQFEIDQLFETTSIQSLFGYREVSIFSNGLFTLLLTGYDPEGGRHD